MKFARFLRTPNVKNICEWLLLCYTSILLRKNISSVLIKDILQKVCRKQASLTGRPTASGKPHFGPDLGLLGPNLGHNFFFFEASALLDVRHCHKLQSFAISRKTNDANSRKWQKT